MKNINILILILLCFAPSIVFSQRDSTTSKKIMTGWLLGMSFDFGGSDNKKDSPEGTTFYSAVELNKRLYVGFYGNPYFTDALFLETDDNFPKEDYPLYDISGSSFGAFCQPFVQFHNSPLRISIPIYLSMINLRIQRGDWISENETTYTLINKKNCFNIRPGIMLAVNISSRFHPFLSYPHSFCFCGNLRDNQTNEIIYNKNFNAHWLSMGILFNFRNQRQTF